MTIIKPIPPDGLSQRIDPSQFLFANTDQLDDLKGLVGQDRAMEAIRFGIGIKSKGYNLFALGPSGIGKQTAVNHLIEEYAEDASNLFDWCYVNNFKQPTKPQLLKLPAGRGTQLQNAMQQLVEELRIVISNAFENPDYLAQVHQLDEMLEKQQTEAFLSLKELAQQKNIQLSQRPGSFTFKPIHDGKILTPEEFDQLPKELRDRMNVDLNVLQEQLQELLEIRIPKWSRESRARLKQLNETTISNAVGHVIDVLRNTYQDLPKVQQYLDDIKDDVVKNADSFRTAKEESFELILKKPGDRTWRYQVNVLVDNEKSDSVPVIYTDRPSYSTLIGRIEYESQLGTLITDFTQIKPGVFHKANGGYLILDAHMLLIQPYAWEGLKRVLMSGEVCIESLAQLLGIVNTVSLEPEPIPVDVKVILLGDRLLYYLLHDYDPDFAELFKVAADFDYSLKRSPETELFYASLIATLARKEKLRPFSAQAVATIIQFSMRLIEDTKKLTMHVRGIADLMQEANHWAGEAALDLVSALNVQQAWDAHIKRNSRAKDLHYEYLQRGTLMIDTVGTETGQVNGLSVIQLGDYSYGIPSRITATVRMGEGDMLDIERETEMGGPIHSKGVFILSSFLGAHYAPNIPLSLAASLTFEQSYAGVEGDSASLGELCALLSSLAKIPVNQSIAVTGSVNQLGKVQAIGGVNEKIEGFFDICQQRGLTGEQGVIIPVANREHLMLRDDVIKAAKENKFAVYAISTVDEAIELLTGMVAGQADEKGQFPAGSFNYEVYARLEAFANVRLSFAEAAKGKSTIIETP